MNLLIYCQHVLGIGHLFRTLEIVRALHEHTVTVILGGPPVPVDWPDHVRVVRLPGLEMDPAFSRLSPVDHVIPLETVKTQRKEQLFKIVSETRPDVLICELFPFGRNAFAFELLPLLQAIHGGTQPSCRIVCSVRDILVEKKDREKYEQRVVDRLNSYFDAVLVHGDPAVIRLDETFSRIRDIAVPVIYTGYVCRKADPVKVRHCREQLHLRPGEKFIVVSAGGGSVGFRLLEAALLASSHPGQQCRMHMFTGPYLEEEKFARLLEIAPANVRIERFADDFPALLAAADLSISMGGYNTTMDVLGTGIPALIYPFAQNREQMMRSQRISRMAALELLADADLEPQALAGKIHSVLQRQRIHTAIRLDGAEWTNSWLTRWAAAGGGK